MTQPVSPLLTGTGFALAAGLMWGLVFVAPLLLPEYPPALLAVGRYLAFGLICLPLARMDWADLRALKTADWWEAAKLSAIGNFLYYLALAAAIQWAGNPLVSAIIGTLPVVIAVVSNRRNAARDGHLPWRRLLPSLLAIALGLACVNQTELAALGQGDVARYAQGAAIALLALACWTWYPIRNADWLRAHADRSPRAWATAQGLVTLPMALLGLAVLALWQGLPGMPADVSLPLGPRPLAFMGLMLAMGLLASWGGTLCWNEASQRLPTALVGQLIVFETLAALAYGYGLRGAWPAGLAVLGIALLVLGVVWALRVKPVAQAHPG
ncbi:drug/metabolite transporter (DMT)-like permease [Inhella inkyongensis]|uniref:Drug/metabolite transporter (DMT)-like permease n=1 Tax=Inhella inkyongensis TaxID=392593 RepID=A0A840S1B4_9BURK|nr:drug/metabolite transporter (DMT)-like permease [Inhella inkyongensis]